MATGGGLGTLIPVAMSLVGLVTILRARAQRRSGERPVDEEHERRLAATLETERRMASYLAGRDAGRGYSAAEEQEQETRR
jgi:hypothetical protein